VLERLGELEREFGDVEARLADPALIADQPRYQQVTKRYRELEPLVERSHELRRRQGDLDAAREMLRDASGDDREMLKGEVDEAEAAITRLTDEVRLLLLPKDPNDERNVIVEIRGAEGGEEANLFARDLFEMYRAFAARQGWTVDVLGSDPSDLGGYNEVTFALKGDGVWARMHHEAGPHRVQRVPVTESQGRIHTSSATVTVLPEAEEVEIQIDPNDLKVDVYRSTGPGGQSVNTTDSAVRLTHVPTGIVVTCQNEKSQLQNKVSAMRVLQAKLLERKRLEERAELDALKGDGGSSWGNQMRSYVLHPYQMVKDLRTDYEVGNPAAVLDGDIDGFLEAGIRWRNRRDDE
jgi:peptide chain release factor 1